MRLKKQCIDAERLLIKDLIESKFTKPSVIANRQYILEKHKNRYKDAISINDAMMHSYAISIDNARYNAMCKIFKQYGFKTMPTMLFGSTFKDKSGAYNCKHSHMRVV